VLATDISGAALARAREGVYRARSVRELDAGQRARYFEARGDQLAAGERLRALVTFARHNLTADPPPAAFGPFHLILCRNVLIYFDGHTVAQVLGLLSRALVPGGMLVLGAADALCAGAVRLGPLSVEPLAPVAPPVQRRRALRRPLGRERADAATSADGQAPADRLRSDDPFDAHGDFLRGLAALERDEPQAAVQSLRRALFAAPRFALAAFTLGRAHEAAGDRPAARRAYEQALRTLTGDDAVEGALLEHVDADEVIAAARARLAVLSA
jgi:chemotaxis protein methyltransferase CheR